MPVHWLEFEKQHFVHTSRSIPHNEANMNSSNSSSNNNNNSNSNSITQMCKKLSVPTDILNINFFEGIHGEHDNDDKNNMKENSHTNDNSDDDDNKENEM